MQNMRAVEQQIKAPSMAQNLSVFSIFNEAMKEVKGSALDPSPTVDLKNLRERTIGSLTTGAIPRDTFALSIEGARINTDKSYDIIDLSSMTLNCILGANDMWVKFRKAAFLLSDQPQYVTIRLGHPIYYSYVERLSNLLRTAGFTKPVINDRQCNGSDVVELAIHAAYLAAAKAGNPRRKKLAAFKGSYHGQNLTAALVSEHQPSRFLVDQPSEVEFFEVPNYKSREIKELSAQTQQILEKLRACGEEFFAVIIEPIQVRNTVHEIPLEFLHELRKICDEKNICLIFDEIQTCFGWLGTLCAAESHGVVPDIALFSKAVTSGHGALAIMVANEKYREVSSTFSGKTNAGDLLTLVAADAVLDRLYGIPKDKIPASLPEPLKRELELGLISTAAQVAEKLDILLTKIKDKFPTVTGQIKGRGLVKGLEIVFQTGEPDEKLSAWLINKALDCGVYVRQSEHVIIFKPPLVTTNKDFADAYERLCEAFQAGIDYREQCATTSQPFVVGKSHA